MPHQVGVVEFPGRAWLIVEIIDDADRWSVRFILGGVLANSSLKNSPHAWEGSVPSVHSVDVVLQRMWYVLCQFARLLEVRKVADNILPCEDRIASERLG